MATLHEDSITFGKYKGLTLTELLRDRGYCKWFLEREDLAEKYSYIYNRIAEYSPQKFFLTTQRFDIEKNLKCSMGEFLRKYHWFNLLPLEEVKTELKESEKTCYSYYLELIGELREKIIGAGSYNIKAPVKWLKKFETKYEMSRDVFKEFLSAYELPNITYIVEDIKKMGGVQYNGARSFLIAKKKSLDQEDYWQEILKKKYGEDVNSQFQFDQGGRTCFFDFIRIADEVLYECKLGLKDFNEDQHQKYMMILGYYSIIYLIGRDGVVNIGKKTIYTTHPDKYTAYINHIPDMKAPSKFDNLITDFKIELVEDITTVV